MGWLAKWRLNRAAKQYARRLPRRLRQGWGGSKTYTRGQIDASVRDLHLNPSYLFVAYAVFLSPEDLAESARAFTAFTPWEARVAFERARPFPSRWSANDDNVDSGGYVGADNYGDFGGHHGGGH